MAGGATVLWLQTESPFAGGVMRGTRPLFGRGAIDYPVGVVIGAGLDARKFTDLSNLTADRLITPADRFYVRTRYPDKLDASRPWTLDVNGLVRSPLTFSIDDLKRLVEPMGTHLLECAGNNNPQNFGLMSAARWSGVSIARVLDRVDPTAAKSRVLIAGFDEHSQRSRTSVPGASWIFTVEDLRRAGAFFATEMNGAPLQKDHGFPLRLVVPRWYGCTCIKWVNSIQFVPDDAPATPQMQEFAARTFQDGRPDRARDFSSAVIDHAAMPIRVEKWIVNSRVVYRVVGIIWGGAEPTDALAIRFNANEPYVRVSHCPKPTSTSTWSLWSHVWHPPARGRYDIVLKIDDPKIQSRRLDVYYYARSVDIDEI